MSAPSSPLRSSQGEYHCDQVTETPPILESQEDALLYKRTRKTKVKRCQSFEVQVVTYKKQDAKFDHNIDRSLNFYKRVTPGLGPGSNRSASRRIHSHDQ